MKDIIYDYIIAGSGIAGNVCAYELSRNNKSCLILEKENTRKEKVCGGGVPSEALDLLRMIDIDVDSFVQQNDVSKIYGDTFNFIDTKLEHEYTSYNYSLGTKREIFDEFLLRQALKVGASIKYGQQVKSIKTSNGLFIVNGYKCRKFVSAIGARGFDNKIPKEQSVGISAQIRGESDLKDDRFYFWYYEKTKDKYFWIFPIGNMLWNIGIWYRHPNKNMRKEYELCIHRILNNHFKDGFIYEICPKGEFLGNVNQISTITNWYGIGDFVGTNNIKNGGGIFYAIESAINFARDEIKFSYN